MLPKKPKAEKKMKKSNNIWKVNSIVRKLCTDSSFQQSVSDAIITYKRKYYVSSRNEEILQACELIKGLKGGKLWKTIRGGQIRENFDDDTLQNLMLICEQASVFLLENESITDLVMIQHETSIKSNFEGYRKHMRAMDVWGDRVNCPESVSESLPSLFRDNYYQRVKLFSSTGGKGDGYVVDEQTSVAVPVEVKYTSSGGVRQTFSPNQVIDNTLFYVLSTNKSDILASSQVNIEFYECRDDFRNLLLREAKEKDARKKKGGGTGRYEISNMIQKIENNKCYFKRESRAI